MIIQLIPQANDAVMLGIQNDLQEFSKGGVSNENMMIAIGLFVLVCVIGVLLLKIMSK